MENKIMDDLKDHERNVIFGISGLNLIIFWYIYKNTKVSDFDLYIMLFSIVGMIICILKTSGINISKQIMIINHYWFITSLILFGLFSNNKHILLYVLYLFIFVCSLKLIFGQCIFSKLHDNDWNENNNEISKQLYKINLEHCSIVLGAIIALKIGKLM